MGRGGGERPKKYELRNSGDYNFSNNQPVETKLFSAGVKQFLEKITHFDSQT